MSYMQLGAGGFRLMTEFELGPDGKPATEAYLCSAGVPTLWLGITEWPNGDPVRMGEFCTPQQGQDMMDYKLREFCEAVCNTITRPMTQNQFDAFLLLAWNVGKAAFAQSTVAELFNQGAPDREVAAAFGLWCKTTSGAPDIGERRDEYFLPVIGKNSAGKVCWINAEGKPTTYQRAKASLLRRHLSEACLFLNLDWPQACRKETVSLIAERYWDSKDNRWEDRVRKKTELTDILPIAKRYPLEASTEARGESQGQPATQEPTEAPTSPALTPDSAIDNQAATDPASAGSLKGGGGELPASQPEVRPPLPEAPADTLTLDTPLPESAAASTGADASARAPDGVLRTEPKPGGVVVEKRAELPPVPVPRLPPPPSVPVNPSAEDMGGTLRNMFRAKRFWGGFLIVAGRIIIATDVTGNFAAPVRALLGDGVLLDWTTGVIVNVVGEVLMDRGVKTAKGPMATPKEIALATSPPVRA